MPCASNTNNQTNDDMLWNKIKKDRKTGDCFNGYKVVAFNSVDDYSSFIRGELTLFQKEQNYLLLDKYLENFKNLKQLKLKSKKYKNCLNETYANLYKLELVNDYRVHFLKDSNITTYSFQQNNNNINQTNYNLTLLKINNSSSSGDDDDYSSSTTYSTTEISGRNYFYKFISMFT